MECDGVVDDSAFKLDYPESPASPEKQSSYRHMQPVGQIIPNRKKDFLAAYTTILTNEQRVQYKTEFNLNYAKYRKLHNVLDQVIKRFSHLETKLKQHQQGSEGFKDVKAQIYTEYERPYRPRLRCLRSLVKMNPSSTALTPLLVIILADSSLRESPCSLAAPSFRRFTASSSVS